ncbi:MAG: tyrosine-type recombinase/integrase [Akkermansiaceae bacterium]
MATFYQRTGKRSSSPYYWIRYRKPDGTWASKSSGIKIDTQGGLRRVRNMVRELTVQEQEMVDIGAGAMFKDWVVKWICYKYENPKTAVRYMNAWAHLEQWMESNNIMHPAEITYKLCHEYMRWRTDEQLAEKEGRKACVWNTALTELRVLGAIMQEAVKLEYVSSNPCARLRLGRRNTKEKREITAEEQEEIEEKLKHTHAWMQEAWLVAVKQGCRLSEVAVPLSNISLATGVITFNVKGGKQHSAPLHRDLYDLVHKKIEAGASTLVTLPKYPSKLFCQWFNNHGFEGITFHCIRVTVVTRLARAGYSESQTMEYVGHCSEMVHSIYRKLKPADLKHLGDAL